MAGLDHALMARALRLAERGLYTTSPNPRVGCVIAHGERVVGEGWHRRAGEPHAEVFALRAAGDAARGATAYVTLEPCAHQGRTPPCADALVAAGIRRVVAAIEDPFPAVAGRGLARLQEAGVAVEAGVLAEAARELNRGFLSRVQRGRPWVRVKLAMSLDGRTALANGTSKWITGEAARADVQRWRARSSAILTGVGTVLADDPQLTVRLPDGVDFVPPLRVVLDRGGRTPAGARVNDTSAPTWIASDADPAQTLRTLAERGVNEVQVEAGPVLSGALVAAGLVDEMLLYVAPTLLGDAGRPLLGLPRIDEMRDRLDLRVVEQRQVGHDIRLLLRFGKA
jgi:diaminohydroxyphosphoribosylaminopyrimidine deaminase/5-amino-6-(5-phosphoribosylamino)uracil reductase